LAAGFAAVAAWLGTPIVRIVGVAGVLLSLVLTGLVAVAKARENRKILAVKQRWAEKQATNLMESIQTNCALILQTNFK
jgi:ligand-binding sensor protein